ncbi:MAG: nicotinate-nucleotide adenylyltransferase [Gammaproteobacteria bacterium]|nr:nicotinate-nucleotide adenylyltransferase [Gammaproteobacteria bacterium]MCH9743358.1 nicotinate-nucleotide adenylyltransferase [Gammaproteobacteria bacterium]
MSLPKQAIGILGGTFDPFHNGHLAIAEQLLLKIPLDRIEFIPCKKPATHKQPIATAKQRLQMTRLGVRNKNSKFCVNAIEMQRAGISYMVDTLQILRSRQPKDSISLIIGSDVFQFLNQWLHWHRLLTYAHIIVVSRPQNKLTKVSWLQDFLQQHQTYSADTLLNSLNGSIYFQALDTPNISSSQIREKLAADKSVNADLPMPVLTYIEKQQLY